MVFKQAVWVAFTKWPVMGSNRMTYVQHYGTNARESELIAAAERVLATA